jgi:hypothetical protein
MIAGDILIRVGWRARRSCCEGILEYAHDSMAARLSEVGRLTGTRVDVPDKGSLTTVLAIGFWRNLIS